VSIFIGSYDQAASIFASCRSATKGKPINGSTRLFRGEDGKYVLGVYNWHSRTNNSLPEHTPLAIFHPNNTLEFVFPKDRFLSESNSLVIVLDRITPIGAMRVRTGVYKLAFMGNSYEFNQNLWEQFRNHRPEAPQSWEEFHAMKRQPWKNAMTTGALYKEGLTFDLDTGLHTGAEVDYRDNIIPEKRKEWLRMLRKFKRGVKVRIRIGALDSLLKGIRDDAGFNQHFAPRWNSTEQLDMLESAIRNEEFPVKLLDGLVRSTIGYAYRLSNTIEPKQVMREFDNVMRQTSVSLRQRLGVFGEPG